MDAILAALTLDLAGKSVFPDHFKVVFTNHSTKVLTRMILCWLTQVVTEHELVARSEAFEAAIEGGNADTLHDFCVSKAQADPELSAGTSESKAQEAETWSFLSILYEAEGARR